MTDHDIFVGNPESLKLLHAAGWEQESHPLDEGLFIHPTEKRAAYAWIKNAPTEEVEELIRSKEVILWNVSDDPGTKLAVLKRLGRR